MTSRLWLCALFLNLHLALPARAADVDGESLLTPNQQRRITQVNHDLPGDLLDQAGDSRQVVELRGRLRLALGAYQQAVRQFGNGTQESRQAAHQVMEIQQALHKQFVQEEATPAVASR